MKRRTKNSLTEVALISLVACACAASCTSNDEPPLPGAYDASSLLDAATATPDAHEDVATHADAAPASDAKAADAATAVEAAVHDAPADSEAEADAPLACSGWLEGGTPNNCTHTGFELGMCNVACVGGMHVYTADCHDGRCDCKIDNQTQCSCALADSGASDAGTGFIFDAAFDGFPPIDASPPPVGGTCGSCCPGLE